jgi:hypothetical protein
MAARCTVQHDKTNSYWAHDARGIPLRRVCGKCEHLLKKEYRADVLTDSNYRADEPIEAD